MQNLTRHRLGFTILQARVDNKRSELCICAILTQFVWHTEHTATVSLHIFHRIVFPMDETDFSVGWKLSNEDSLQSSERYNLFIPAQPCVFTCYVTECRLQMSYTNKKAVSAVALQTYVPKLLFSGYKKFPSLLIEEDVHHFYMPKVCHCTYISWKELR